ncbi:transposase, MuDR, plant [Tanacetum coccineum]|uniref:Transposase, MuDR, plant n=1 Tax=Tanacetum coccineum TaxID=301880 RepID=A0ABQ5GR22_9ASTR
MASSSSSSSYLIRFHRGGVFVRDPFSYDYEMLSEIPNVDMGAMNFVSFVKLLVSECSSDIKQIFYHVASLSLELGLRTLKNDEDLAKCVDDSDLDDVYVYDSESEESETASVNHLSDGEEEVYDARTRKPYTEPKKYVSAEKDVSDEDNLGDKWPIYDPTIKWKLMRPVLGEKYESPEQLKRALVFYALANGYKLYCEVNNPRRLLAKCCRDDKDNKCPFSQARRGKMKALQQYKTCLEDHYGMLWSYASEILNSNPGSTSKMSVDSIPDGKNYFNWFYVCFKGLREGWLQGCRRVIGLDGCFLKTICKGELLSAVARDGNNQIYPIAWVVVSVENKDNWSWFMELLINDLGLVSGKGLTIISDQHKGIIEAAKQVMPLAEHRQCVRHIYANFRKKYTRVQYRNLFWKVAKATYPTRISECFNAMIVDARRKPIINMLKDIRVLCMERLQKMREKHAKWTDGICPNIRKSLKSTRIFIDIGMSFQVGWKLSGIPCEHGIAAIYFLHKDPENYVSDWYNKDVFVNAYNHYIEGMNGMDQWPTTDYQKPLPPFVRRMPGRPPHKRKRDAIENDGNRTRISRKGQLNHCTLCKKPGHNQRACPSKPEVTAAVSAKGGNVTARGGKVCARGGKVTAMGGIVMASGGNVSAGGRKVTISGGKVTVRGRKVSARGGKISARGGKVTSTSSIPPPGFEMSTPDTASSVVRTSRGAIKLREGVWIRSPEKEMSSYADTGSSSINKLRTINGKVVSSRGRGDGSKSIMYPFGIRPIGFSVSWDPIDGQTMLGVSITPQDCIIHAATQSEIALSHSQPIESQKEEPRKEEPRHQEPRQQQQPRQQQ